MSMQREATSWQVKPRWRILRRGTIALGPGKVSLLEAIEEAGSISAAAKALGMSYRRAWMLVATMNRSFREPLVETSSRRQAGARLTSAGRKALRLYRRIESRGGAAVKRETAALLAMLPR